MPDQSSDSAFNPWTYKPWWCQPWSILLTGSFVIGGSWWLGHRIWLTLLVTVPITLWWIYFLVLWPQLLRDYLRSTDDLHNPSQE